METLVYYIGLYLLVLLLKFINTARKPSIDNEESKLNRNGKPKWQYVLHVSLDVVYTSAGFAIALIENLRTWIPAIMIIYIILVILSTSVDNLTFLTLNTRTIIHGSILLVVISTTILGYTLNFGKPKIETSKGDSNLKIVIPYIDLSLMKHTGLDFSNTPENNFRVIIKSDDETKAKQEAIDSFYRSNIIYPLFGGKDINSKHSQLKINYDEIIVQNIK
jgi:hypothetical protein